MAVSALEYSLMAGNAYFSTRGDINRFPFPEGWVLLPGHNRRVGTAGFEAAAFQRGNDIVISFAGTYDQDIAGDIVADGALATGNMHSQLLQAAKYYLDVKTANPNANITFTGHSLGGGLAALIAVFFDRPAQTFDQAPFFLAASTGNAKTVFDYLVGQGMAVDTSLSALADQFDSENPGVISPAVISRGRARVDDMSVVGEFLSTYPISAARIGNSVPIPHGASDVGAVDLHSQALLIAFKASEKLRQSTYPLSYLVKDILDGSLFAASTDTDSGEKDFLTNLIHYEFGIPGEDNSDLDLLTKFGNDTAKLGSFAGAGQIVTEPLLEMLMNYYYEKQEPSEVAPAEFFTKIAGGLQFDLTQPMGEMALSAIKGYADLLAWITQQVPATLDFNIYDYLLNPHRLTLGLESSVAAVAPNDGVDDVMLGGAQSSYLDGGAGDDVLVGLGGSDSMIGGDGDDTLVGGTGNDRYEFKSGDGHDTLIDSDGKGSIFIDGHTIYSASRLIDDADNEWHTLSGDKLTLNASGSLLIEVHDNGGSITIDNFDRTQKTLGITLGEQTAGYNTDNLNGSYFDYLNSVQAGAINIRLPSAYANAIVEVYADPALLDPNVSYIHTLTDENDITYQQGFSGIQEFVNADDGVSTSISSSEQIAGASGDDMIIGNAVNNVYSGNNGADILLGGDGNDFLAGDIQKQRLISRPGAAHTQTIIKWGRDASGTYDFVDNGVDNYDVADYDSANDGNDFLDGGDGDDIIEGNGGDDVLIGSYGNDSLQGESGSDYLSGGSGNDQLNGDYSNGAISSLSPSAQKTYNDVLDGGDGDDTLDGGYGADQLYGGAGNDILIGDSWYAGLAANERNESDDYLDGGAGNDKLYGYGGNNTLLGGAGDDTLEGGDGLDWLMGGDGVDTLYGGRGNDNLEGGANDDALFGAENADILQGGTGHDELYGGAGNDTMDGGADDDYLQGDDGNDVYIYRLGDGNDTIDDSQGQNTLQLADLTQDDIKDITRYDDQQILRFQNGNTLALMGNTFASLGIELASVQDDGAGNYSNAMNVNFIAQNVMGTEVSELVNTGSASDTIFSYGGNDVVNTFDGDDAIDGGDGNDTIHGDAGNDTVFGGIGVDYIDGGDGDDTLIGNTGNDTIDPGNGNDMISVDGYQDVDTVMLQVGATGLASIFIDGLVDNYMPDMERQGQYDVKIKSGFGGEIILKSALDASAKAFSLNLPIGTLSRNDLLLRLVEGDEAANVFSGSSSAETYHAHDGNDTLSGGAGNDTLYGEAGNDTLYGNDGNDRLIGGQGSDTFLENYANNGGGDDTYTFDLGDGIDVINDAVGNNVYEIGVGISSANVQISRRSVDTFDIGYGTQGDQFTINGFDDGDLLRFADGATLSYAQIASLMGGGTEQNDVLTGTTANNSLFGLGGSDVIYGYAGNDVLDGGSGGDTLLGDIGDDTLIGGTGNDSLDGGAGNDLYLFNRGDELDSIVENGAAMNEANVLRFGAGISLANLQVSQYWSSGSTRRGLWLTLLDGNGVATGDAVHLDNYISNANGRINRIEFQDGSAYSFEDIHAMLVATTTSSDSILAFETAETIDGESGNDAINGRGSDDTIFGGDGDDSIEGGLGNDVLLGGNGDDTLKGYGDWGADGFAENNDAGADSLNGGNGKDVLWGGAGNDLLSGDAGDDKLYGGLGNDTYFYGRGQGIDTLIEEGGTDTIRLAAGILPQDVSLFRFQANPLWPDGLAVVIDGSPAQQIIVGEQYGTAGDYAIERIEFDNGTVWTIADIAARVNVGTSNTLTGTSGDDTFTVDHEQDVIVENVSAGLDTVNASRSYILPSNVENLTLTSVPLNINATGNELDNVLRGNAGNNRLDGAAGNDTAYGGAGDDTYYNIETIFENANEGIDTLYNINGGVLPDNVENFDLQDGTQHQNAYSTAVGNALDNILWSSGTSYELLDTLDGGLGADTMISRGGGSITFVVDNVGDRLVETTGFSSSGNQDMVLSSISFTLPSFVENLTLQGSGVISGAGNERSNTIVGNDAANLLSGGAGRDTLDGRGGDDTLIGGDGDDFYIVDSVGDTVIEGGSSLDFDTVNSSVTYTLGANLEGLTLAGSLAINATGNVGNNSISGNSGDNTLDGGAGDDTLSGGAGNDVYIVDSANDIIYENASAGIDTVVSTFSYSLGANLENLTLTGTATINGTGNALGNIIRGNSAINTLSGGLGNDTYYIDSAGDVVVENASEGIDGVVSSIGYTAAANIENVTLTGSAAIDGTGNTLDNVIVGNSGSNILTGDAGNDVLDGQGGADSLRGGIGDDLYYVETVDDLVEENVNEGTDTVNASISYTLAANIEYLALMGATAINGTGNALSNAITGNSANNVLDGGAGADTLIGGAGNDTYVIDDVADSVVENAAEGTDTVNSSITYTLGTNVENLTLMGSSASNGFGNTLSNRITGNSVANTLNGGTGADTMIGGLGNDVYFVDNAGDVVTENANEGTDAVNSSLTYTLGANVENLILTGATAINGTGNASNNVITGNSAINTLTGAAGDDVIDGGAGADKLIGGTGNDTYTIDNTGDVITENASEGTDLAISSVTYTLVANLENLTLTGTTAINGIGNTSVNILTGNSGNNTLDGGTGADTLIGGLGNDVYVVDNVGDVITENANEGTDAVNSSVTYTLSANVENLTLTGTTAINATGNASNNTLTGNSAVNILTGGAGDDVLNGGTGADTMIGGTGNDTFFVDNASDVVAENAAEGTDTVNSSLTYTLGTNTENLILTGTTAINGTGNASNNAITGNSAANTLTGAAGDDVLNGLGGADRMVGGTGNDSYFVDISTDVIVENASEGADTVNSAITYTLGTNLENLTLTGTAAINGTGNAVANVLTGNGANNTLTGTAGNDTYVFGRGGAADTIVDTDSTAGNTDVLSVLSGVAIDQLWFRHVGNNLEVSIIGTSDTETISNWYSGSANHIEQFKTSDGKVLLDSQVENLVSAMAAFSPPSAGQTTLPSSYQTTLEPVIAANWH